MQLRRCEVCGQPLMRHRYASGRLESPANYATRRTCGRSCSYRLAARTRWANDPHAVGQRTLVARSCEICGALKAGSSFPLNGAGYRHGDCATCRSAAYRASRTPEQHDSDRETSRAAQARRHADTLASASRWGEEWTDADLEALVAHDGLPVEDVALLLGRTHGAVNQARIRFRS